MSKAAPTKRLFTRSADGARGGRLATAVRAHSAGCDLERKVFMEYVIIGNSAAAVGCIEGIRKQDKDGTITLISDEPYFTYSRPLISYLLLGRTDRQRMQYRPDDFYDKNRVRPLLGKRAKSIDPESKQVVLDDGTALHYDKLLVATGSRPFVPPAKGLDGVEHKSHLHEPGRRQYCWIRRCIPTVVCSLSARGSSVSSAPRASPTAWAISRWSIYPSASFRVFWTKRGRPWFSAISKVRGLSLSSGTVSRNTRRTPPCFAAAGNWILTCWSLRRACVPTLSWWPNAGAR